MAKKSSMSKRMLLRIILSGGKQITPAALDYLLELPNPVEVAKKLSSMVLTTPVIVKGLVEETVFKKTLEPNTETETTRDGENQSEELMLQYKTNLGKVGNIQFLKSIENLKIQRARRWGEQRTGLDLRDNEIIPFLDLEPLAMCENLRTLSIMNLGLERVDFTPLGDCSEIETITISNILPLHEIYESNLSNYEDPYTRQGYRHQIGHIEDIDLTPLKNLKNLRVLNLDDLQTGPLELRPLGSCSKLDELRISGSIMLDKDAIIRDLDLQPVTKNQSLRVIELRYVDTKSIDLNPLLNCRNLREIVFSCYPWRERVNYEGYDRTVLHNRVIYEELDLSNDLINLEFFTKFRKLKKLDLSNNGMRSIDLSPLAMCKDLQELYLTGNGFHSIDFTPIRFLPLHIITLDTEKIDTRQGDPFVIMFPTYSLLTHDNYDSLPKSLGYKELPFWRNHKWQCNVPVPITTLSGIEFYFNLLRKYNEQSWKYVHLIQCVPKALDIQPIGLFDGDAKSVLQEIIKVKNTPFPRSNADLIAEILCKEMVKQIERGGTTIGVLTEKEAYPILIKEIHRIAGLRASEMNAVGIPIVNENEIDYLPLWSTAYGNQLLSTMKPRELKFYKKGYHNKGSFDSLPQLKDVQQVLLEVGFDIQTDGENDQERFCNMSESTRDYLKVMLSDRYNFDVFSDLLYSNH